MRLRIACLFLLSAWPALAGFQLDAVYSDHMVLQRDRPLVFEGDAPDGTTVTVRLGDSSAAAKASGGRWKVELPARGAGGPFAVEVSDDTNKRTLSDVLVGDVWICGGQSNMHILLRQFPLKVPHLAEIANPQVRILGVAQVAARAPAAQIEIEKKFENSWQPAAPPWLAEFSAVGYFFANELQHQQKIPIGVINASKGGSKAECWLPYDVLGKLFADFKTPGPELTDVNLPGGFYYGMIAPLTRFPVRGIAWYQGESNGRDPLTYARLFPAVIEKWRAAWKRKDLPFAFVQVTASSQANVYDKFDEAWAWLREAQDQTRKKMDHAGMAVSIDCGEYGDSHPQNKEPVGKRLAAVALKLLGQDVIAQGPAFKSVAFKNADATIEFDHFEGGLESRAVAMNKNKGLPPGEDKEAFRAPADTLAGFTLSGTDHVFHPAKAEIEGTHTVRVSSPEVPQPVAVRYAFSNFPLANLYNKAGFPAEPFRTDNFPPPSSIPNAAHK